MDKKIAKHINTLMNDISSKLDDSVMLVRDNCSPEEVKNYLIPVSHIMALMADVLDIIYTEHPELQSNVKNKKQNELDNSHSANSFSKKNS